MAVDVVIRGGGVVSPGGVVEANVVVDGGLVVSVGEAGDEHARETIDAEGCVVLPGVIDPHVHFNEPGRADWEGFATGSAALAAGGGTCFFDMPLNSDPPLLTAGAFDAKRAAGEARSRTDFGLWGGLTPQSVDRMEEQAERGVVGFKAFMCDSGIAEFGAADERTLRAGMAKAAALGRLVGVHAESAAMTAERAAECRRAGKTGWRDFLWSRPVEAELEAVELAIDIAADTGCRLHVVHVSHPTVAEAVVAARASRGVDVTSETCPHYLAFCDDDLVRLGGVAKCAPPLRDAGAVRGMWAVLGAGAFAFVGSDHSPCPAAMKVGDDAFSVWGGVAGVQSTLGVVLNRVDELGLERIAALTAARAADRFGVPGKGRVAEGYDADLTLVDLDASYTLSREMLKDRHRQSPYVGMHFRGVVTRTLVRGQTVWRDGQAVGEPIGRLVTPA